MGITPENSIFIVLAFEGPDVYSMAGGLGARITHLTTHLAGMGYEVHHFFIGDPGKKGIETFSKGKLILHRWCQWISQYHPGGVYDGEEGKLNDFVQSAPAFVVHELVLPALRENKTVVILGEEWHTAEAMCRISDLLWSKGVRNRVVMFWNANNTYSFERINWQHITSCTTLTTVSKYMKQIMLKMGINPLVVPNGIEKALLREVKEKVVSNIRQLIPADLILSKVARWHPDKGWRPAIQVIDRLKKAGRKPVLLARGSVEAYGNKITSEARSLGLTVKNVTLEGNPEEHYYHTMLKQDFTCYFEAISRAGSGDILNLSFPIPHSFLRAIYKTSDLVLANSTHEPFGLVGLEAMATGAVVFTGCSGEDYAIHLYNAIVLDTFNAGEIEYYINFLQTHPEKRKMISSAAKRTAKQWIWEEVVKELICKLEFQARLQGIGLPPRKSVPEEERESTTN